MKRGNTPRNRGRGGANISNQGKRKEEEEEINEKKQMEIEEVPEYEEDEEDDNNLPGRKQRRNGLLSMIDNNILKKLEIRPKKGKDKVNKTFLQLKRKRKGKTESDFQSMLNIIYKVNARTLPQIQEALAKKGQFIKNKDTENFIVAIANTKVSNQKIQLSANASNIPLYTYQSFIYPKVGIISNDILYLWCLLLTSVTRYSDEDTLKIVSTAKFVDVQIASELFDGNSAIDKGYAQDFTGECCVLNINKENKEFIKELIKPFTELSEKERKKIKKDDPKNEKRFEEIGYNQETEISSYMFEYDGKEYFASADNESCLIFPVEMPLNEVEKKINETIEFHDEKGRYELFAKAVPTKDKPRFISCRVKGDNFCPCFMKFEEAINCNYLYRIKMDNNRLFEYWDQQIQNEGADITKPRNILYWDNIESFFDFLQIYMLTSPYGEYAAKYKVCVDIYYDNKTAIMFWKQNQLEYQRILYEFFNSFNTKLNYDKLMKLYNRIKKYIEARALLMSDTESFEIIPKMFKAFGRLCEMINNQFNAEVMFIADKMLDLLDQLDRGILEDTEDLRKLGYAIYCCSYMDDTRVNPAFPFIFAPGAFLGNVQEGINKTPKQFKELISEFKKSMKTIKKTNEETVDLITNAIETNDANRDVVVENTFIDYLNDKGINKLVGDKKLYDKIFYDVLEKVNTDNKLRKAITQGIISSVISGEKVKEMTITDDDGKIYDLFDKIIAKYNKDIEKVNEVSKEKLNELRKKRREIQEQIDEEKDKIDSNNNKLLKENEGEEEEKEVEEEEEKEDKKEDKKKKKSKSKKKPKTRSKSSDKEEEENIQFQQGVDEKFKLFTDPKYKEKNMKKFLSYFGNKGLTSNIYAYGYKPKGTKSIKTSKTRSALGYNIEDVVNDITKPSEIYDKLADVNEGIDYNGMLTENGEPMSDELKGRLKVWYLTALKNNGLDEIIGRKIYNVSGVAGQYKDFRDVMKDYPVRWDELFNQAFDNDKFKLLEALNNLNKNGVVEKYKIDMSQESIAAKKKILTDLLENLGKK